MDVGSLYGRGVGFGFGLAPDGRVALSEGPVNIRQSIEIILSTEPGERLLRPSFGAGLRQFLFEPNTPATHRLIEERITRSIERWEPRVRLDAVSVIGDQRELAVAVAEIRYNLVATSEPGAITIGIDVAKQVA